jgi:tetratricopeptide (TPR) repeat protein
VKFKNHYGKFWKNNSKEQMNKNIMLSIRIVLIGVLYFAVSACTSHLKEAKFYYTQREDYARIYESEKATASFKRAVEEAGHQVKRNPSAQAYMIKGLAELNLDLWEEAKESFLKANAYGFEKGEEWASQLSLYGLASTLQEMGLEEFASEIFQSLLGRSKVKAITLLAAQNHVEIELNSALKARNSDRQKHLKALVKTTDKLITKDLSCGYYHYLQSQVLGHLREYRKSFERAVMAKELGLPTEQIFRDNDNQIVYCYQELKKLLQPEQWVPFESLYLEWVKRWGWKGPETPSWQMR